MSGIFEDPRMRQRWNRISYNAGEVTENAAAGIWSFQHNYLNPCLGSLAGCLEQCTAPCLGDREERARRRRDRERARGRAEYSFDFYDDWYADYDEQFGDGAGMNAGGSGAGSGLGFGTFWGGEDWDRLLAGTGAQRRHAHAALVGEGHGSGGDGLHTEQPKRRRGMSFGVARGGGAAARRKTSEQDPTVIPSTQAIGFLGRLPWKLGKTLRYKPSAADLQDHPGQHEALGMGETEPLLRASGPEPSDADGAVGLYDTAERGVADKTAGRTRSGTTGSGDTSDSYRSRGDLFPSDGEGDEDAVPLDDEEFSMVLDKLGRGGGSSDDRSSGRTRSSKGKRPEGLSSRTVSRATIGSLQSRHSTAPDRRVSSSGSLVEEALEIESTNPTDGLELEEERLRQEEDAEIEKRRRSAAALAIERGLQDRFATASTNPPADDESRAVQLGVSKATRQDYEAAPSSVENARNDHDTLEARSPETETYTPLPEAPKAGVEDFVPARLPYFK